MEGHGVTTPPPSGDPGDSKNCSDFESFTHAKTWFDHYYPTYGDVAMLDADNDLVPCEELQ